MPDTQNKPKIIDKLSKHVSKFFKSVDKSKMGDPILIVVAEHDGVMMLTANIPLDKNTGRLRELLITSIAKLMRACPHDNIEVVSGGLGMNAASCADCGKTALIPQAPRGEKPS